MIKLIHKSVNTLIERMPETESCKTIDEFIKLIINKAKQFDKEDDQNKFKGNMFEVFVEFFIKYFEPVIGIVNYTPNIDEDYGTDGFGMASNSDDALIAVQSKFKSDPTYKLNAHELSTFVANSFGKYKVSDHNHMVLISTTYEVYYTVEKMAGGKIRHINLTNIERLTNNTNISFWEDFWISLNDSIIIPIERKIAPKLWDHQKEAIDKIQSFLEEKEIGRKQIIIPTGGGKTTIERESINSSINLNGLVHVIMAPRIYLLNQILRDMHDYKVYEWDNLLVRSGMDERLKFYSDDEYDDTEVLATTSTKDIMNTISNALETGRPLIIFSTYHSADKIGKALNELDKQADLCIGDEAHNMVGDGYFNDLLDPTIINTKKWLFFTATRIISTTDIGKGMNNVQLFGQKLFDIQPVELIKAGIIVQPRIHIMHLRGDCRDIKYSMSLVKSAVEKQIEDQNHLEFRLIVACKSVDQAHQLSKGLKEIFSDFYVASISSNTEEMKKEHGFTGLNSKDRDTIFNQYSNSKFSILLHYSILSEGIDLPGTTAILPLRTISPVGTVQFSGRASRINSIDREKLNSGEIKPGDITGWIKPYGWIILHDDYSDSYVNKVEKFIESIRSGFDIDVDHTFEVEDKSITINSDDDVNDLFPHLKKEIADFNENVIHKIEIEIKHDIEEEERALIRQDQTLLDFFELPKGDYELYGKV